MDLQIFFGYGYFTRARAHKGLKGSCCSGPGPAARLPCCPSYAHALLFCYPHWVTCSFLLGPPPSGPQGGPQAELNASAVHMPNTGAGGAGAHVGGQVTCAHKSMGCHLGGAAVLNPASICAQHKRTHTHAPARFRTHARSHTRARTLQNLGVLLRMAKFTGIRATSTASDSERGSRARKEPITEQVRRCLGWGKGRGGGRC